jgi:hypothetical protein
MLVWEQMEEQYRRAKVSKSERKPAEPKESKSRRRREKHAVYETSMSTIFEDCMVERQKQGWC